MRDKDLKPKPIEESIVILERRLGQFPNSSMVYCNTPNSKLQSYLGDNKWPELQQK